MAKRPRDDKEDGDTCKRQRLETSLSAMSDELLLLIMGFMDAKSINMTGAVSSRFHSLAHDQLLWKHRYKTDFTQPKRTMPRLATRKSLGTIHALDAVSPDIDWRKRYRIRSNWSTGRCETTTERRTVETYKTHESAGFVVTMNESTNTIKIVDSSRDKVLSVLKGSGELSATVQIRSNAELATTTIGIAYTTYGILQSSIQIQEIIISNTTREILNTRTTNTPGPGVVYSAEDFDDVQNIIYQHPFLILPSSPRSSGLRLGHGNSIMLYLVTSNTESLVISPGTRIDVHEQIDHSKIGICLEFGYLIGLQRDHLSVWNLPSGQFQCLIESRHPSHESLHSITSQAITTGSDSQMTRFDFTG